jgi:hypothetical protein
MPDTSANRDHEVVLCLNLTDRRVTQHLLSYRVPFDDAYAVAEVIRKILEGKWPNRNE